VGSAVTIGRLPDNTVVIENPAVSGHHARVVRDGTDLVLEDLESTNGTFVNDKHVVRHVLQDGDVVLVGKHRLVFEGAGETAEAAQPADGQTGMKSLGDTLYLDTKQHRALIASLRDAKAAERAAGVKSPARMPAMPPSAGRNGLLRVLDGRTDQTEYRLDGQTSVIGASDTALVRLHGWFKPKVALAIARSAAGYVATPIGGKPTVNGQALSGRHELKEGDIIRVGGLTLEFALADSPPAAKLA